MTTVQRNVDDIRERMESLTKAIAAMAESQTRMEAKQKKLEQWIYNSRGYQRGGEQYSWRKATSPFEALASLRQRDRPVEDRMEEAQNQKGTKGRYDLPLLHLGRNEDVSGPANTSTQAQQSTGQTLINTSGSSQTGGSLREVVVNGKWKQNGKPITAGLDYNGQATSSPSFLTSPNQFVDKFPDQKNDTRLRIFSGNANPALARGTVNGLLEIMPPLSDRKLEERLSASGNALYQPPYSLAELLRLLVRIEELLLKVEQSPAKSMLTAFSPQWDALIAEEFLKHSDGDVKVGVVASCISEITRITAPNAPYDDDKMKEVFHLIVSSFEDGSDTSSSSHHKKAFILETIAEIRSCVIMLEQVANATDEVAGNSMAVDAVVTCLKSRAGMISTAEEIVQVGTISDNGEREIGELIAKVMEKVGKEYVITIQDGKTLFNELEVGEGMKLDRGYISPYVVTNQKNQIYERDDALILIHEKTISSLNGIVKVLALALEGQRPLLIVDEDVESEALALGILNKISTGSKVGAIKASGFGENKKSGVQDLAVLTGGQVLTEELGLYLDEVNFDMLGSCKKVAISKDDTVILDGAGEKKDVEEISEQIRSAIKFKLIVVAVHWKERPPEEDTWEDITAFTAQFSYFNLGDKVALKSGVLLWTKLVMTQTKGLGPSVPVYSRKAQGPSRRGEQYK
ncbi:chaperonin-60kD, ch60 [Dorcoceras hygrometricum]|uniref:Chaperonin-60kD, ch60 n=1 Tax=Dorcoceras hygrometricum TaxID=472368 RepID=A0A2Z7C575_9LAMI|nr:chaperonin-60kD, ch60 [Dorcoceras hygrometricum]